METVAIVTHPKFYILITFWIEMDENQTVHSAWILNLNLP